MECYLSTVSPAVSQMHGVRPHVEVRMTANVVPPREVNVDSDATPFIGRAHIVFPFLWSVVTSAE